jgi:class 3 adenylate cyclase/tetratricopeptide (TPR) repeat protein
MRCPVCLVPAAPDHLYCPSCGGPLRPDAASRHGVDAYTPSHLIDGALRSAGAVEGERKQVAVLFCDIVGSTAIASELGSERMHALLDAFFRLALSVVHRYSGTINQFRGDGFMALFGAPRAIEDPARLAVLASLELRNAIARDRADRDVLPAALEVRIGLNAGLVVVGRIGDALRADYTANGPTTHVAARLHDLAAPGEILAAQAVHDRVRTGVDWRLRGRFTLRGVTDAVEVYEALGTATRVSTTVAMPDKLIGRHAERALLAGAVADVRAGHGRMVVLEGEAGIGKSRLIDTLVEACVRADVDRARGSARVHGRTQAYLPFVDAFAAWLNLDPDRPNAEGPVELEAKLEARCGPGAARFVGAVGMLLGTESPAIESRAFDALDGTARRQRLFEGILDALHAASDRRPLALILDDWHWADESSASLLGRIARLCGRCPLLVMVALRPGSGPPHAALASILDELGDRGHSLTVGALDPDDGRRLAASLLGAEPAPTLASLLQDRATGHPLYIVELVHTLRSNGLIAVDEERRWAPSRPDAPLPLPDSVEGVILARVDRLAPAVKQALKLASVIGRRVPARLLADALGDAGECARAAVALEQAKLVVASNDGARIEFCHPLIQQAVYDSLLDEQRAALHRRVAESLERAWGSRPAHLHASLAYHFAACADFPRALEQLQRAGDGALSVAADAEALDHYRNALRLAATRLRGAGSDAERLAILELQIGNALFRLGRHDEATDALDAALRSLGRPMPQGRRGVRLALAVDAIRFVAAAITGRAAEGARISARTDPATEIVCGILETRGWIEYFRDAEAFVLVALRLRRLGASGGVARQHALGAGSLALVLDGFGLRRLSNRLSAHAVAVSTRAGHAPHEAIIRMFHALHLLHDGRYDEAEASARAAVESHERTRNIRYWALACGTLMIVQRLRLDVEGRVLADRVLEVGKRADDPQAIAVAETMRADAAACRGDLDEAERGFARALARLRALPDHRVAVLALGLWAEARVARGAPAEALALCEQAESIAAEHRIVGIWSTPAAVAGVAARVDLVERGATGEALAEAARASARLVREGRRVADDTVPEGLRLAATLAFLRGRRGEAIAGWQAAIEAARHRGARRALAWALFDRGRLGGGGEDLERAAELFEAGEMGAMALRCRDAMRQRSDPGERGGAGGAAVGPVSSAPWRDDRESTAR